MLAIALAVVAAANPGPLALVKEGNGAVQRAVKTKDTNKVATSVEGYVDFGELAKRALGKEWDKLSKPQQQDFSTTMKGVLRASYASKAIGPDNNAAVKYGEETVKGDEAEVATTFVVNKQETPVIYKLYRQGEKSGWRVYDVVTDDVSLMETYHDEFRKLIGQKGFDGLLSTLKAKKETLEKAGPPQALK